MNDGFPVRGRGLRAWLSAVSLELAAPARPGRCVVRLDLVNEAWAGFEAEGSDVVEVGFDVDPA